MPHSPAQGARVLAGFAFASLGNGLTLPFLFDMVLRAVYNRGRLTGAGIAADLKLPFKVVGQILPQMRRQRLSKSTQERSIGMPCRSRSMTDSQRRRISSSQRRPVKA